MSKFNIYLEDSPDGYDPDCRTVSNDGYNRWAVKHLLDYYPNDDILSPSDVKELQIKAATHGWEILQRTY